MADLLGKFADAVARHPDRVAIVDGTGRETTFAGLQARAGSFAGAWAKRGIGPGDRVLLAMRLDADLYAALAALWSLGATVVLPEPAMGLRGLRHAARVTEAQAFCSSGAYGVLGYLLPELWAMKALRPRAGPMRALSLPEGAGPALISFTSGTSGAPKAIPRGHRFLMAQHDAVAPLLRSDREERDLVTFPVFVLINIAAGRTSVLPNWRMSRLDRLRPDRLCAWASDQRVSRALLPPSLCRTLARGRIPRSLHTVFTGGGPVFPDILDALRAAKPDLRVACVYGSTEAEPIAHLEAEDITEDDRAAMEAGGGLLVGHPVEAVNLRITEGGIEVAGPHVNEGYLDPRHDAGTKVRDGGRVWHRTGDAGRLDPEGRLWLLGRMGEDVTIAAGALHPFSVEVAARTWPGVRAAALVEASGRAVLAVEGDTAKRAHWIEAARALGIDRVTPVRRIPMDRRHASKVDRAALRRLLG